VEAACLREAERIFAAEGQTLAALVVEPLVQGAAGMLRHSPAFLDALMGLARSAGVLIIADEVATGFGRTGTIFALEQCHHRPDLLCLAKGITGGYLPLAVTMTTASVYEAFRGPYAALRTFFHGHTYTANPLACAAALANLELFADGSLLASLPEKIQALERALAALPSVWVSERRQTGLMAGALLRDPPRPRFAHEVCLRARRHGVIVRPLGDLIVFMPPLAMQPAQIAETVQAVGSALAEAWASGPP
jgi:adenosylmethionine-8-amino-7-oxononanoate aminotransferase